MGWLKKGLQPKCITRDINWGVEIPIKSLSKKLRIKEAKNKRIYVWFEAVIGYLSASIEWSKNTGKWRDFWYSKELTTHYYFMGKDNLVFHTLFWPAQLYGAYKNIHLPDYPAINHFLNLEGHPFSKSRGIFVDAKYVGEKYGIDPVRFYLTLIMPEISDADFSWSNFVEINNNVLIGTFGNFLNRTLKLSSRLSSFSKKEIKSEVIRETQNLLEKARGYILNGQFKLYAKTIIGIAAFGNKYLQQNTPWIFNKDSKEFKIVITNALLIVLAINMACEPLIPDTNKKLAKILSIQIETWPDREVIIYLKSFLVKVKINNPKPLFNKIPSSIVDTEMAKLNI